MAQKTEMSKQEFSQYHEPVDFKRPWRIFQIMAEFVEGYDFINKFNRIVAILGSARTDSSDKYYKEAVKLGRMLAKGKYATLTGAGPGIMEAANKGAFEEGGESLGINIELPFEQVINPYVKKSQGFNYFFTRKVMLLSPAQAFVFFPGGYGTMDEFFEVFDLMEIGMLQEAPMIAVGKEYWQPVMDFLVNKAIKYGILDEKMLDRVFLVDKAEDAYDIIASSKDIPVSLCPLAADKFECEKQINWRVFKIMAELVEGFDMVTSFFDDVTILGSKSLKEDTDYYHNAYKLGLRLGENKHTVITGGGPGITEAANKGAFQTGATSVGLVMRYDHTENANDFLTSHVVFEFPFTRKLILTAPSQAFVIFPGGLGTMHQAFELLTLLQTRKARKIPVMFFDADYWQPLLDFIKEDLLKKYKTISKGDEDFFKIVNSVDEVLEVISALPREGQHVNKSMKVQAQKAK